MFEKLKYFFAKHIGAILLIVITICVLIPLFVHLCYDGSGNVLIKTEITADGMLGYLGASVGSVVALAIALIGICREKKHEEEAEELRKDNRKNEIRPRFHIEFKLREDGCFDVVLSNHNKHPAFDIYFVDRNILPFVKEGNPKKIKVCFDFSNDALDAYYFDCDLDGDYPKDFYLIYTDIDGNIISEKFKHFYEDRKHLYKPIEHGYEG